MRHSPTAEPYGKGSFVAVHSERRSGADDGFVSYEVDWDETFAKNPTGVGKVRDLWGASPAGRTGTVAVPARHRPDHHLEGGATPGRRTGPPGDARLACLRGGPALRRPVDPHPRRRRRIDGADLRREDASVNVRRRTIRCSPANTGDVDDLGASAPNAATGRRRRGRHRHTLGRLPRCGVVARPRRHRRGHRIG